MGQRAQSLGLELGDISLSYSLFKEKRQFLVKLKLFVNLTGMILINHKMPRGAGEGGYSGRTTAVPPSPNSFITLASCLGTPLGYGRPRFELLPWDRYKMEFFFIH